jgi:hypothetical protein
MQLSAFTCCIVQAIFTENCIEIKLCDSAVWESWLSWKPGRGLYKGLLLCFQCIQLKNESFLWTQPWNYCHVWTIVLIIPLKYILKLQWWSDQQIRFLEPKYTFKCSLKPTSDSILNHSRPWYSVAVGSTVLLSVYPYLGVTILFWGVLCILSWSLLSACYISCQFFRWFICLSNIRRKEKLFFLCMPPCVHSLVPSSV